jgi:hypothetical protein
MGKSLSLSSNGLSFGKFMRALIQVPKEQIDETIESEKKKRQRKKVAPPRGGR